MNKLLLSSIQKLGEEFPTLNWSFSKENINDKEEVISYWPGDSSDDIMICVLKSNNINEQFHRQDFFFFNFAYRHDYRALSAKYDNLITIHENECYIGQPFSGYALKGSAKEDIVIIGVLIQKETFFREYLPTLAADNAMFHFFLDPQTNKFSDEFIRLAFEKDSPVRLLLEMMVVEYADRKSDTQAILKPMALTLFMHVARKYCISKEKTMYASLSDRILRYISEHSETVSLKELASHFSYHPNYISSLLHNETGMTFSKILLAQRMERAAMLLKATSLSIEEIAPILGYNSSRRFYMAFQEYYHMTPREYVQK